MLCQLVMIAVSIEFQAQICYEQSYFQRHDSLHIQVGRKSVACIDFVMAFRYSGHEAE